MHCIDCVINPYMCEFFIPKVGAGRKEDFEAVNAFSNIRKLTAKKGKDGSIHIEWLTEKRKPFLIVAHKRTDVQKTLINYLRKRFQIIQYNKIFVLSFKHLDAL